MATDLRTAFIIISLWLICGTASAQGTEAGDRAFGLDPVLHNGKIYSFQLPYRATGTQYLRSPEFEAGSATIKGIQYAGLMLNYDVYNQQVLLKYSNQFGANSIIALSQAWLQQFDMGGTQFLLTHLNGDTIPRIVQLIGEGPVKVFYAWSKMMKPSTAVGAAYMEMLPAEKKSYLQINHKTAEYSSNRTFVKQFAPEKQASVKHFMKQHRTRVRKAGDEAMKQLIKYCNTLNQ